MIGARQHAEQIAELSRGVMPCRFCGLEWFWAGNRHDPLRLAGVSTMRGQGRRLHRALTLSYSRLRRAVQEVVG